MFRAFSFECYAVQNKAQRIIPVASKELAYELKQKNPGYLLAGERRGIKLPGFDYGNSPTEIENLDLTGRTIVHTTSAGTQGLENAHKAAEVMTGSLVNAKAIAAYIKLKNYDEVSLVCMGNEGIRPAAEDELCAGYIKSLLLNQEVDISGEIENLKFKGGERFFDPAQRAVFPQRDFYLCTALNSFDFVLKFEYDSKGLGCIRKIDII